MITYSELNGALPYNKLEFNSDILEANFTLLACRWPDYDLEYSVFLDRETMKGALVISAKRGDTHYECRNSINEHDYGSLDTFIYCASAASAVAIEELLYQQKALDQARVILGTS